MIQRWKSRCYNICQLESCETVLPLKRPCWINPLLPNGTFWSSIVQIPTLEKEGIMENVSLEHHVFESVDDKSLLGNILKNYGQRFQAGMSKVKYVNNIH